MSTTYNGRELEIIGVSADYKVSTVGEGADAYIHLIWWRTAEQRLEIIARTRADAGRALLAAMRRELIALEPNILFLDNQTMDDAGGGDAAAGEGRRHQRERGGQSSRWCWRRSACTA
jgi:hypothetical protein